MAARGSACRICLRVFAALYAAALLLLLVGTFGLFGSPRGPLAGVFLIPLGLPWVLLGGGLTGAPAFALGVLAPALNLGLLGLLCAWLRSRAPRR